MPANVSSAKNAFKLIRKGDPILLKKCQPVSFPIEDDVYECIDTMKHTLRNVDGFWEKRGISMAAPQVGYLYRLFIMCNRQNWYGENQFKSFQTFINPKITAQSEEKIIAWEGCVSENDSILLVERPMHIKVEFNTLKQMSKE